MASQTLFVPHEPPKGESMLFGINFIGQITDSASDLTAALTNLISPNLFLRTIINFTVVAIVWSWLLFYILPGKARKILPGG